MKPVERLTRFALILSAATFGEACALRADQTTIAFDSGANPAYMLYANSGKTVPLSGGSTTAVKDGDGDVLRLGYYTTATTTNFFSGTFIPLSGQGTSNTAYATTSIGDSSARGGSTGTYALSLSFTVGSTTTGNNLPTAGTLLAIQFYNNTTLSTSTLYNVVSDSAWTWQAPGTPGPTVTLSLDDANLQFLGDASSAFYTSQQVPEPSTVVPLAGLLAGVAFLRLRRRCAV